MNSGPPESPLHVFEFVPGGPRGATKSQHTCVRFGIGVVQNCVTTLPARLTPESTASSTLMPKPAIVPVVPLSGLAVVLIRDGAIPDTGVASLSTAMSPPTANWNEGLMVIVATGKKPACCRKNDSFDGSTNPAARQEL